MLRGIGHSKGERTSSTLSFFYEALQLAQADGDLDDREQELVENIMHKVFEPHPAETTLVQIARVRIRPGKSEGPV